MALTSAPAGRLGRWALFGSAGLVLVALIVLSGAANIVVWWMTGEGWTRFWYTGVGLACEIWAALGLVIITSRFVRGEWARGAIAVALWLPAVAFNAYTVHRFLEMGDETHERAAITLQADRAILEQDIADLQSRIEAANVTRSIAAIETELALVPETATTATRRLSAELQLARDVEAWRAQVSAKRAELAQGAGAAHAGVSDRLNNEWIMGAMAIWIEAMKALCLFVLRGRVRARAPNDALRRLTPNGGGAEPSQPKQTLERPIEADPPKPPAKPRAARRKKPPVLRSGTIIALDEFVRPQRRS